MEKKIIIIGASNNKEKYGYKAVKAYIKAGYVVHPVNPTEKEIQGLKCYQKISDVRKEEGVIELASLYVPPKIGETLVDEMKKARIKKIYLNPGTESKKILELLKKARIEPIIACSILASEK